MGGAGNDNIDGDLATDWVGRDWTATRSVSSGVYTTDYGQSNIFDPGAGGDDFIYAGGGDNALFGTAESKILASIIVRTNMTAATSPHGGVFS